MTKAEKNFKRDFGHKDSEELSLNFTRDSLQEELDQTLSEVSPNDLTEGEQEYLDGRHKCRNHTLNIRFNDTEWAHICSQADLLKMKKSSYVRDCVKAHYVFMFDREEMQELIRQVRGISTNINQTAYRANSTGRIYPEDITAMKARLDEIWQLLNCIQSGVQLVTLSDTSWTGTRPQIIHLWELLCARQDLNGQRLSSETQESE